MVWVACIESVLAGAFLADMVGDQQVRHLRTAHQPPIWVADASHHAPAGLGKTGKPWFGCTGLPCSLTDVLVAAPRLGVEGTSAYLTLVDTSSSPVKRRFMLRMKRMSGHTNTRVSRRGVRDMAKWVRTQNPWRGTRVTTATEARSARTPSRLAHSHMKSRRCDCAP